MLYSNFKACRKVAIVFLVLCTGTFTLISAGIVNPDISAIGKLNVGYTDDSTSPSSKQGTLKMGEAEVIFDAYLNPYFTGIFNFSIGESGLSLEEGYTQWVKGLPWGLQFKVGKYRQPFGKLNPTHPHAYPFMEPPRVMAAMLPGDDGFNENAIEGSALLPTPGDWAATVTASVIEAKSFHVDEEGSRLGWLAHWNNSFLLGERGAMDLGFSGAQGKSNLAHEAWDTRLGADWKTKWYVSPTSQWLFQAELFDKIQQNYDSTLNEKSSINRMGAYVFTDLKFLTQYNAGVIYDFHQKDDAKSQIDQAVKVFAGYAVLEESTLFRFSYEYFKPDLGEAINTYALQLLFSMGPHKAHQF